MEATLDGGRTTIREVVVVEGPSDISAVRRAVDAELVATGGFAIHADTMARIRLARERCGVVVLTDPDHAGEAIRRRVEREAGPCKHAWVAREDATRDGDVGIEHASPEVIRAALAAARVGHVDARAVFTLEDLVFHGLTGAPDAAARREALGHALGLGHGTAGQLLRRLNHYGVGVEELATAMRAIAPR